MNYYNTVVGQAPLHNELIAWMEEGLASKTNNTALHVLVKGADISSSAAAVSQYNKFIIELFLVVHYFLHWVFTGFMNKMSDSYS